MKRIIDLQNRIDRLPRVKLAKLPTPLEEMSNLEKALDGPKIWIKRDDLTGIALGGNKERGIEFIIADAIQKKADVIITSGDIQSNHARVAAAAARKLGLKIVLVLKGKEPQEYKGNLFLCRLFGADIRFIQGEWENVVSVMDRVAKELQKKGYRPYIVPNSGSYSVGALGYFNLMLELLNQAEKVNLTIDYIVFASGSGGTQAGLTLANKILNAEVEILGICVEPNVKQWLAEKIVEIANDMAKLLDLKASITPKEMVLLDNYAGAGYGEITPKIVEIAKLIAQAEGILLDPVYTSKAMIGLIDLIKQKYFKKNNTVVFIHTGGTPTLFAYEKYFKPQ